MSQAETVRLDCADGVTITTTLRAWDKFVSDKVKLFDARLLTAQGKQIKCWNRRRRQKAK